jgi:hypothetical protein
VGVGNSGGVIAVTDVLDEPSVRSQRAESRPFVRDHAALPEEHLRVDLGVRTVLDPILRREVLKEHPKLASLSILRMAHGTNFPVTPEEAEVIEDLIARRGQAEAMDLRSLEGLRRLYGAFRRAEADYAEWHEALTKFLEDISASDEAT